MRSFSLTGLRSDADFMLWRIGYELDAFEAMQDALMKTGLGKPSHLPFVREQLKLRREEDLEACTIDPWLIRSYGGNGGNHRSAYGRTRLRSVRVLQRGNA